MRFLVIFALVLSGCSAGVQPSEQKSADTPTTPPTIREESEPGCADVVEVSVTPEPGGTTEFRVTVLSADEGWDKYADEWTVRLPDGTVVGTRTLAHPHENEQPFTRSLSGVPLPEGTTHVIVAARDSVNGYCGAEYELSVP